MINSVTISGNLVRDIELRQTNSGFTIGELAVAVNERRKDASGEWGDYPNYFDCKLLGSRAEKLAGYLVKGTKVTIAGKLQQERWEKDGQKRSKVTILVDDLEFMSRGESGAQRSSRPSGGNPMDAFPGAQVSAYSEADLPF